MLRGIRTLVLSFDLFLTNQTSVNNLIIIKGFLGTVVSNEMSESRLDDLLACSVCLEEYKDPKILNCHHSFCKLCLNNVPLHYQREQPLLKCPTCRKPTPLKEGGVSGLPPSFLLNSLLDTNKENSASPDELLCEEHHKPSDIFCEDCDVVICHHCLLQTHRKHSSILMSDYYAKTVHLVKEMSPLMKRCSIDLERATESLDKVFNDIVNQYNTIEEVINSTADKRIHQINQCRQKLLQKTHAFAERKIQTLQAQSQDVMALKKELKTCEESVAHFINESSKQRQVTKCEPQIISKMKRTFANIKPKSFEPAETANLVYIPPQKELNAPETLGSVKATFVNESFTGEGNVIVTTRNKKTPFIIIHQPTSPFVPPTQIFSYTLAPYNSETATKADTSDSNVEYIEDLNLFRITFIPKTIGHHLLTVNIRGEPIMGGPFNVYVFPQQTHRVLKLVNDPRGIALGKADTIAVSENSTNKVLLIHRNGGVSCFPCPKPVGIAITPDERIVVAADKSLKQYTFEGRLLFEMERSCSLTSSLKGVIPLSKPNASHGVTVSKDGRILVTETSSGTLRELNPDFSQINYRSDYSTPTGVAVDRKGDTYVLSKSNSTITKCNTLTGETKTFCSKGSKEGQLKHPMDIAIDCNGILYVADTGNHRISVFNSDGQFLKCIGQKGNGMDQLQEPCGVAVDSSGRVCISDTGNNRIVIYK